MFPSILTTRRPWGWLENPAAERPLWEGLHLLEPTGGEAFFVGEEIGVKLRHDPRDVRQKMQIIFQDPYGSLNPRMTVNEIVGEAVKNLP